MENYTVPLMIFSPHTHTRVCGNQLLAIIET